MFFSIEEKRKNSAAIKSDDGVCVTYEQLCSHMEEIKNKIDKRSLIFCLCENSPASVIGYLGILHSGSVPLLLDAKLEPELFQTFFQVYGPQYLWMPENMASKIKKIGINTKPIFCLFGYGLYRVENEAYPMSEQLCLLLATSGSTGSPKLVRLSEQNLEANAEAIAQYLGLNEKERPITTLPMHYTYGLSIINSHLLRGSCILMTKSSLVQQSFWNFFQEEGATSIAGVPYTYEILKKMHFLEKESPKSLHYMTQAGGGLPQTLQKEFGEWAWKHHISFFIMYGQTEATARMSYLPPDQCLKKLGSIGVPIPGGKFYLLDDKKNFIYEPGICGELVYQGENVSLGYAQCKEELGQDDVRQGILYTGDLAEMDQDGFYYIRGRKKRFIKLLGVRIGLDDCERRLKENFPGMEAACIGKDDKLHVFMTKPAKRAEVEHYLVDVLKLHLKTFQVTELESLPKNSSGKLAYQKLEKWYGEE